MINKYMFGRLLLGFSVIGLLAGSVFAEDVNKPAFVFENDAIKITTEFQHDKLPYEANSVLAIHFDAKDKWHFYSDPETSPAPNLFLQIDPRVGSLKFGKPLFPSPTKYFDKTQNKNVNVYSGKFTVYIPFKSVPRGIMEIADYARPTIIINGAYCSDFQCRVLRELELSVKLPEFGATSQAKFELPKQSVSAASEEGEVKGGFGVVVLGKLILSILTGLMFNVMPCVLPVIPLVITKLLKQSQESKARSLGLGATFCFGIISFFAVLAIVNIVLKVGFGTVFQWADYMRLPWFIKSLSILLVFLGLFMFGLFNIGIPSSVTSKAGSGEGFAGSLGMGFLAALLSTPCTFGVLVGLIAWAQTQNLVISTAVFLLMGVGMALPYAILIVVPGLLKSIPKPGDWMERVKQAVGFVLLIIAIKLLESLAVDALISILYFAVIMSVAVWMWGSWITYSTPKKKKRMIRFIALVITVLAGFYFLPADKGDLIDWQEYDAAVIDKAKEIGQPVLIKFDAKWCATCKVVDKRVYQRSEVAELVNAKNVLAIKGDTTTPDLPATAALQEVYDEPGVPVSVIWLPGEDKPIKLRGMISKKDVVEILETIE